MKERNFTTSEVGAFLGKDAERYLPQWVNSQQKLYNGWNMGAAILGFYWYASRKMYLLTVIFASAMLSYMGILFSLMKGFVTGEPLDLPLFIGVWASYLIVIFFSGLFANTIYYRHARRILARTENMTEKDRLGYLKKKGRTSNLAAFISNIIVAVCGFIMFSSLISSITSELQF